MTTDAAIASAARKVVELHHAWTRDSDKHGLGSTQSQTAMKALEEAEAGLRVVVDSAPTQVAVAGEGADPGPMPDLRDGDIAKIKGYGVVLVEGSPHVIRGAWCVKTTGNCRPASDLLVVGRREWRKGECPPAIVAGQFFISGDRTYQVQLVSGSTALVDWDGGDMIEELHVNDCKGDALSQDWTAEAAIPVKASR